MTTAKDRSLDRSDGNPLWVRIAAAKVAVAASKVTGRPVDPRVLELSEMTVPD